MRFLIFLFTLFTAVQIQAQIGPAPQKNAPKDVKLEEQKKMTPKQRAYNIADAMKKSFKLNEKQHTELRAAFLNYETNMDKLTKQKGLSLKELAKKKHELNMQKQNDMKRIFTPEQYKRYQVSSPGG